MSGARPLPVINLNNGSSTDTSLDSLTIRIRDLHDQYQVLLAGIVAIEAEITQTFFRPTRPNEIQECVKHIFETAYAAIEGLPPPPPRGADGPPPYAELAYANHPDSWAFSMGVHHGLMEIFGAVKDLVEVESELRGLVRERVLMEIRVGREMEREKAESGGRNGVRCGSEEGEIVEGEVEGGSGAGS